MSPFLKGLLIGLSIAAPVGPIGVLCIRRTLMHGRLAGFVSGLGAATADAVYGVLAAAGLTAVATVLLDQRHWLQLFGGAFLLYLGIAMIRARPPAASTPAMGSPRLAAAYLSTLVLTLTNPMTILSFIGIFAGLGFGAEQSIASAVSLVIGVFAGSTAWWFILSTAASWFGRRLTTGGLRRVNCFAGAIILSFGLWQLASLFLQAP